MAIRPTLTPEEELAGRARYLAWKQRTMPGLVAVQRALAEGRTFVDVAGDAARRQTLRESRDT